MAGWGMAEIVLCCGKVSSGKSTFARLLGAEYGFHAFSADAWMLHFYGEPAERDVFEFQLARCKEMIYRVAESLLARNQSVVLDFGFWRKVERQTLQQRFAAACQWVYFPIDAERQSAWLDQRQAARGDDQFYFDADKLAVLNALFEAPEDDEVFSLPDVWLSRGGRRTAV